MRTGLDRLARAATRSLQGHERLDMTGSASPTVMSGHSLLDAVSCKSEIVRAAIDVDCLAGNEAAILADKEQAGRGDLVDMPLAPKRNAGGVRQATMIPLRIVAPCIDAAGRHDINPDVVWREFGGEPARHADQPHLGCG